MKLTLSHHESGQTYIGEGPTILAALGALDRSLFEQSGMSLADDCGVDFEELFAAVKKQGAYERLNISDVENNFTLSAAGADLFAAAGAAQWREIADAMLAVDGGEPLSNGDEYAVNDRGAAGFRLNCNGPRELTPADFDHLVAALAARGVVLDWRYMTDREWADHKPTESHTWSGLRELGFAPSSASAEAWALLYENARASGTSASNGVLYHGVPLGSGRVNVWLFRESRHSIEDLKAAAEALSTSKRLNVAGFVSVEKLHAAIPAATGNTESLPKPASNRPSGPVR